MTKPSWSWTFPVGALLFACGSGFAHAQHADSPGPERQHQRESDAPVRQGIASDGTPLHEGVDVAAFPVGRTMLDAAHQGQLARGGTQETHAATHPEDAAYRNRVVCEHRRSAAATEWQCRPHMQQR